MGIERGLQLKEGKSPWTTQKGRLLRGFRSALDGSVQPYRVTVPEEYDGSKPFPLDVAQHGRAVTTYEVNFINNFAKRARRPNTCRAPSRWRSMAVETTPITGLEKPTSLKRWQP